MNVLILHPSLNTPGGGEKVCLTTIEALKEYGYEVILGTTDKTDWHVVRRYYGKTFDVTERQLLPSWMHLPSSYRRIFTFPSSGLLKNVDLSINMHGDTLLVPCDITYLHIPTFALARTMKDSHISVLSRFYLAPYIIYQKLFAANHYRKTTVLTNSSYMKAIIRKYLDKQSHVVYPPVDVKTFFVSDERSRDNIVVTCSRFSLEKKLELLPDIAMMCPEVHFYVLGSTGLRSNQIISRINEEMKKKKLKNLKVLVNPSNEDMVSLYKKAKIYLHLARGEFFGISIVEAMVSGLVPIVHKSGGAWIDILKKGKYGVGYKHITEAAQNINELIHDEKRLRKMRRIAQNRARKFSNEVYKKRIVRIVNQFTNIQK